MKRFISLANCQTIYYLWNDEDKRIVVRKLIKSVIDNNFEYKLNNFNHCNSSNVRSYLFFESNDDIIMVDFNYTDDFIKYNLDLEIIKYYEKVENKKIYLIMFNFFEGKNSVKGRVYSIYQNKNNNNLIKFLFSKNTLEQTSYDEYNLVDYFKKLDNQFYAKYLNEQIAEANIYSLFNI